MSDQYSELIAEWNAIQEIVSKSVVYSDSFDSFSLPTPAQPMPPNSSSTTVLHTLPTQTGTSPTGSDSKPIVSLIAGADISFDTSDSSRGVAAIVVLQYPSFNQVYCKTRDFTLNIPYISGYLAFREKDVIVEMMRELQDEHPELYPQVLFIDGNGLLHPRRSGCACHVGVELDIPTIGVGKTFLAFPELHWNTAQYRDALVQKGDWVPLIDTTGFVCGASVKTAPNIKNPIFISVGHRFQLESAVQFVVDCCKFRQPEPIRAADHAGREFVRLHPLPH
ncbi:putative Endonuclease V [Blattamonas nauphoetae]|uniref:Endonuclease V n=1 Tax=Blattamonas nauphoetae TaxID=2049346 RepID=A0ABQ9YLE4_9EUKA|nr:putative Endonuclease V [Blattamonas nauphoetae]